MCMIKLSDAKIWWMFLLKENIKNLFLLPTFENSTSDSEYSEDDSDDEVYYPEKEASLLVKKDDIAVIKTSDVHSYYLLLNYYISLTLHSKLERKVTKIPSLPTTKS